MMMKLVININIYKFVVRNSNINIWTHMIKLVKPSNQLDPFVHVTQLITNDG